MTREQEEIDKIMWDLYESRRILPNPPPRQPVAGDKAFCPTGEGGGVDNSCSSRGGFSKVREMIDAWQDDEDISMSTPSRDRMIAAAVEFFSGLAGVREVRIASESGGSSYFDLNPDDDDAASVSVRISNHDRKPNSHLPPTWSFQPGDSVDDDRRGVAAIERAVKDELENAIYQRDNE